MPTLGTATFYPSFAVAQRLRVGVMCADIGHCDKKFPTNIAILPVGVMCADIGHCDKAINVTSQFHAGRSYVCRHWALRQARLWVRQPSQPVGVMCADIGHCDM